MTIPCACLPGTGVILGETRASTGAPAPSTPATTAETSKLKPTEPKSMPTLQSTASKVEDDLGLSEPEYVESFAGNLDYTGRHCQVIVLVDDMTEDMLCGLGGWGP